MCKSNKNISTLHISLINQSFVKTDGQKFKAASVMDVLGDVAPEAVF